MVSLDSSQMDYKAASSKAWACNILNLILIKYKSTSLTMEVAEILFNRTPMLPLLGGLLEFYSKKQIMWPYTKFDFSRSCGANMSLL